MSPPNNPQNQQNFPTLEDFRKTRALLSPMVHQTPVWKWVRENRLNEPAEVYLKLELFQKTGTFKVRGALNSLAQLSPDQLKPGVTTFSGGNHAIALSYAAQKFGASAKVVMPKSSNLTRKQLAQKYGAEVVLAQNIHEAFTLVKKIEQKEGRAFIHPFEGPSISFATGTIGLELCEQISNLDAVVVPIGGGGLCSGIATAVKLLQPSCKIYGIEPQGANSMQLSLRRGAPVQLKKVETIADSLGSPSTAPYSFSLCRKYVDRVVIVNDEDMKNAMRVLFSEMKLAVEPAGAASTAGLLGPLKNQFKGQTVALIISGSNMDNLTYSRWLLP